MASMGTFIDPRSGKNISYTITQETEDLFAVAKRRKNGLLDLRCTYTKRLFKIIDKEKIKGMKQELKSTKKTIKELENNLWNKDYVIKKQSEIIEQCSKNGNCDKVDPSCNTCQICADVMIGQVELKCGHSLCPDCFAKHSRVSNVCPYCRDEFSSKPKKQREHIPDEVLYSIADTWSLTIWNNLNQGETTNYFYKQQEHNQSLTTDSGRALHLKWLVTENSKLIMKNMRAWYEAEVEI